MPKYYQSTRQVLVRNFTWKPLERKFVSGYQVIRILSDNAYELRKPNGKTFKVNTHHIMETPNINKMQNALAMIHHLSTI